MGGAGAPSTALAAGETLPAGRGAGGRFQVESNRGWETAQGPPKGRRIPVRRGEWLEAGGRAGAGAGRGSSHVCLGRMATAAPGGGWMEGGEGGPERPCGRPAERQHGGTQAGLGRRGQYGESRTSPKTRGETREHAGPGSGDRVVAPSVRTGSTCDQPPAPQPARKFSRSCGRHFYSQRRLEWP